VSNKKFAKSIVSSIFMRIYYTISYYFLLHFFNFFTHFKFDLPFNMRLFDLFRQDINLFLQDDFIHRSKYFFQKNMANV